MQWVIIAGSSVTPVDNAASSIVGYVLSYGPLGIITLALAWLFYKGWRLVSPSTAAADRETAREDLIAERDRVIVEKQQAEDQRDEALTVARDQIGPMLSSFVAATGTLIPLLQEIIREPHTRRRRGGPDP